MVQGDSAVHIFAFTEYNLYTNINIYYRDTTHLRFFTGILIRFAVFVQMWEVNSLITIMVVIGM